MECRNPDFAYNYQVCNSFCNRPIVIWIICLLAVSIDLWGQGMSLKGEEGPPEGSCVILGSSVNIEYRFNGPFSHPDHIEIWYQSGQSHDWRFYGYDNDKLSPVLFTPPSDGLYRLLIIAVTSDGLRSIPLDPAKSQSARSPGVIPACVEPQIALFFDQTDPSIYLQHDPIEGQQEVGSTFTFSWVGFDAQLSDKPVTIYWESKPSHDSSPRRIIGERCSASGTRYWRIPVSAAGESIRIIIEIKDRAGRTADAYTDFFEVKPLGGLLLTDPNGHQLLSEEPPVELDGGTGFQSTTSQTKVSVQEGGKRDEPCRLQGAISANDGESGGILVASQICLRKDDQANHQEALEDHEKQISGAPKATVGNEICISVVDPNAPEEKEVVVEPLQKDSHYYYRKSRLYSMRGEWQLAIMSLQATLDMEPKNLSARLELADIYYKNGNYELAAREYELCRIADPQNKVALFGLAQTQLALNNFDESRKIRELLLKHDQPDWESLFLSKR